MRVYKKCFFANTEYRLPLVLMEWIELKAREQSEMIRYYVVN